MGFFAVTCAGADELGKRYMDQGDDYSALLVKTLADRLAEAFAEYLFLRVRREFWGYAQNEVVSLSDILRGKVRGIRPAPGYPAAPDHALKAEIFRLLDVERKFGMKLTESYMMQPGASVCGMYFAHPKAMYFSIGKSVTTSLRTMRSVPAGLRGKPPHISHLQSNPEQRIIILF